MLRRHQLDVDGDLTVLRKGCILYSFHFGIWELMPYTLCRLGYRMGIITNRYGAPGSNMMGRLLDYLLKRWRTVNGIKVFYKENTLQIVRFVKSGGVFGMLVDGNSYFQKHGRAKKLADLCEVPLVPFAAYRSGKRTVLRIGCDIQDMVRAMPNDYVWFYRSRQSEQ
jgi:lauroyl/myristoyl acyltransferase